MPQTTIQLPIIRVVWRCAYVCVITFIAILAPFFNDIVGAPRSIHVKIRGAPNIIRKIRGATINLKICLGSAIDASD